MRIVQFYSGVESFNYFTNRIDRELKKLGHETFILDFRNMDGRYKGEDVGGFWQTLRSLRERSWISPYRMTVSVSKRTCLPICGIQWIQWR